MKKLALFDIDRTLAEGSIGVLFTNFLFQKNRFPKKCYQDINKAIKLNKAEKISYKKRGKIIIENWAEGFKGWSKKDILKQANEYFNKYHYKRVYPGARELVRHLKQKDYYVVGISRAFEEILLPAKKYLGISFIIGTKFTYDKNNICTGKLSNNMWEDGAKKVELMNVFKDTNLTTEESIAFGDTKDDYYMLNFVEFPITVNANKELEKIAVKKYWPIYTNLKVLLQDVKSGKLLPKVDWFHHYAKKYGYIIITEKDIQKSIKNDEPFVGIVKKYIKQGSKILETGCGLGRLAISLSLQGFKVLAIDNEKNILKAAKINCYNFGRDIKLELADMFEIDRRFKGYKFDAVTHGGVLEHFSDNQIKILLNKQFKIAPLIIFSVPIKSERNKFYFKNDKMGHRNLWNKNQWVKFLRNYYTVKEAKIVKSLRKDDLIVVLKK